MWLIVQVRSTLKNDTKLSWPIEPSVVFDENQTGQQSDRSYKNGLRWKWY